MRPRMLLSSSRKVFKWLLPGAEGTSNPKSSCRVWYYLKLSKQVSPGLVSVSSSPPICPGVLLHGPNQKCKLGTSSHHLLSITLTICESPAQPSATSSDAGLKEKVIPNAEFTFPRVSVACVLCSSSGRPQWRGCYKPPSAFAKIKTLTSFFKGKRQTFHSTGVSPFNS